MKNKIKILKIGTAKCIYEPRGDHGLEGYQLNQYYKYNLKEDKKGQYYAIFPTHIDTSYYETCSLRVFKKFFNIENSFYKDDRFVKYILIN